MAYTKKIIRDVLDHPVTPKLDPLRQARRAENIDYSNGDINFIGDCCFAYSGSTFVNNAVTTVLKFNSGPNFLKVKIGFFSNGISNDDYNQIISFNGIAILDQTVPQTYQTTATGFQPIDLIIPPFTEFKVTFQNVTDTSSNYWSAVLTGKVYAGAEIIQGAI